MMMPETGGRSGAHRPLFGGDGVQTCHQPSAIASTHFGRYSRFGPPSVRCVLRSPRPCPCGTSAHLPPQAITQGGYSDGQQQTAFTDPSWGKAVESIWMIRRCGATGRSGRSWRDGASDREPWYARHTSARHAVDQPEIDSTCSNDASNHGTCGKVPPDPRAGLSPALRQLGGTSDGERPRMTDHRPRTTDARPRIGSVWLANHRSVDTPRTSDIRRDEDERGIARIEMVAGSPSSPAMGLLFALRDGASLGFAAEIPSAVVGSADSTVGPDGSSPRGRPDPFAADPGVCGPGGNRTT